MNVLKDSVKKVRVFYIAENSKDEEKEIVYDWIDSVLDFRVEIVNVAFGIPRNSFDEKGNLFKDLQKYFDAFSYSSLKNGKHVNFKAVKISIVE